MRQEPIRGDPEALNRRAHFLRTELARFEKGALESTRVSLPLGELRYSFKGTSRKRAEFATRAELGEKFDWNYYARRAGTRVLWG